MTRRTPKVFFSSYRPPTPTPGKSGQFRQLLIVSVVIIGGYFLTRLPVFQIEKIEVNGITDQTVIKSLNTLVGQSILSSATATTIERIKSSTLEILEIHCDKGIPDTLRCSGELRKPAFIWLSGSTKLLIDESGLAYKKISNEELPVIEDRKKLAVELGEQVISGEMVAIYQQLGKQLSDKGIVAKSYFINTSALHPGVVASTRQDKKPFPKQPIDLFFSSSYPTNTQVRLLEQLLAKKSSAIHSYIDLRTPGYLYYK